MFLLNSCKNKSYNYYASKLLELYNELNSNIIIDPNELEEILSEVGLSNINIKDQEGILIAIGQKL